MTGISLGVAHAIAASFPWGRYQTVIDIGCAEGCVPVAIAQAHAHISGGGFDLPPVKPLFEDYAVAAGVGDRLRFHAGDFFEDPLPAADVLDHGPHPARLGPGAEERPLIARRQRRCRRAGCCWSTKALIDETSGGTNAFGLLMSLNMLNRRRGWRASTSPVRTAAAGWPKRASATATSSTSAGPDSMVVGIK